MAINCDPSTLANTARCFARCIPGGLYPAVRTYLLCRLASNGIIPCTALNAPVITAATGGNSSVTLTVTDAQASTNLGLVCTFTVFYGTTNGGPYPSSQTFTPVPVFGGSPYTFNVTGLTNGTTYYFVVQANACVAHCAPSANSNQQSATAGNGLLNNLLAYWKNDEVGGVPRVTQVNSPGADLAADAGVTNIVGLINNGTSSGGGAAAMHNPSASFKINPGESFTVSLWLQMKSFLGGFRGVFAQWDGGTAIEYFLWFPNNTNLTWQCTNATNTGSQTMILASPPTLNVWHHVVVGYDDSIPAIFFQYDNGPRAFGPLVGIFKNGGANLYVLAYLGGTGPIDGWVDENGFWKRALSIADVGTLYNGGAGYAFSNFTT